MSKSIGKLLGAGSASVSMNTAENDVLNYLKTEKIALQLL